MFYKKEVYKLATICGFIVDFHKYTKGITGRRGLIIYIEQAQFDENNCKLLYHFESWKEAYYYLSGFYQGKRRSISANKQAEVTK